MLAIADRNIVRKLDPVLFTSSIPCSSNTLSSGFFQVQISTLHHFLHNFLRSVCSITHHILLEE
jgi:hypothetical protein